MEPTPNENSRVTLTNTRDELGVRKVPFNWELASRDLDSMYRSFTIVAQELGRLKLGRLRIDLDQETQQLPDNVYGSFHHMGTTRMHNNSTHGGVDENCKVHGLTNLYVAGSSVFPAAGNANPTLKILRFTLSLPTELKRHWRETRP